MPTYRIVWDRKPDGKHGETEVNASSSSEATKRFYSDLTKSGQNWHNYFIDFIEEVPPGDIVMMPSQRRTSPEWEAGNDPIRRRGEREPPSMSEAQEEHLAKLDQFLRSVDLQIMKDKEEINRLGHIYDEAIRLDLTDLTGDLNVAMRAEKDEIERFNVIRAGVIDAMKRIRKSR